MVIDKWAGHVKEQLPSWRGKLLQDNGIPHPYPLKVLDKVDRLFLFQDYKKYFKGLLPRH